MQTESAETGASAPVTGVAVIGAGSAGLMLALALARAGIAVSVLDRRAPVPMGPDGDRRVFALSAGSCRVLEGLGLWPALVTEAQPISDIVVSDRAGPPLVHFDHAEMDVGALAHIVAADALQRALLAAAKAEPLIRFVAPVQISRVDIGSDRAVVALADGGCVAARLVVGADGRNSLVRRAARINVTEWTYDQSAIVVEIAHARPHHGAAEEKFLSGGPFAVLPLRDGRNGGSRSFVVWTEPSARIADLMKLSDADLEEELNRRLGDRLGRARINGPRQSFPLALTLAENYVAHRLALIGDAAHAIHPIAGQGLNLGIRDAAALAEVIVDAHRLGLDFGMKTALLDYERWRRFDNTCLAAATDLLNRVFAIDNPVLNVAREAGMALLDRIGPARRLFMSEAMGLHGDLPRLMRGEPL
jgi:2-octaprenyl-6-methoxyphenol hydroxylase